MWCSVVSRLHFPSPLVRQGKEPGYEDVWLAHPLIYDVRTTSLPSCIMDEVSLFPSVVSKEHVLWVIERGAISSSLEKLPRLNPIYRLLLTWNSKLLSQHDSLVFRPRQNEADDCRQLIRGGRSQNFGAYLVYLALELHSRATICFSGQRCSSRL